MTVEISPIEQALRTAVRDVENHVAAAGWDQPVSVYALVHTQQALRDNPGIAAELPPGTEAQLADNPQHLLSIEQEGLPQAESLEELLAQLAWPPAVAGAAIVVERIVVPPEAEVDMPEEATAAVEYLQAHPQRQDVRMVVGVLREGYSWCALRSRSHDSSDQVAQSADAVPGLVAALRATFE